MFLRRLVPPDFPIAWWLPYTWLVYLGLFLAYAVAWGRTPVWWAAHGAGLAVFLPLYFRGFWLEGWRLVPVVAVITALGAGFVPWNPGASVFFVFAGSFVADIGPPRVAMRWLAAIVTVAGLEALALHLRLSTWLPAIIFPLLIGGANIAFVERRRADRSLRLAQEEVAHLAKVAERERIARDLHDLLGHTLSVIVLKSELAAKLADRDPARAASEIRDVERISRQALSEVRRAVEGYRQLTLAESLAGVRQALEAAGVTLHEDVGVVGLAPEVEGVASLVLREAVTNVVRHSGATHCRVLVREDADRVSLVVADDGKGGVAREGTGLASMRARVERVGGAFTHTATAGTTIAVHLPRRTEREAGALRPAPGALPDRRLVTR